MRLILLPESEESAKLSGAQCRSSVSSKIGRLLKPTHRKFRNDPNRHCCRKPFEIIFATLPAQPESNPTSPQQVVIKFPWHTRQLSVSSMLVKASSYQFFCPMAIIIDVLIRRPSEGKEVLAFFQGSFQKIFHLSFRIFLADLITWGKPSRMESFRDILDERFHVMDRGGVKGAAMYFVFHELRYGIRPV